jgi:RNA polymerase sigma factor (sigma-70 family)
MPDDGSTRASLLSRLRDPGDQAAWQEFAERYSDLILGYCRRRGLQATDAEDVRQLVLMSLSRSLGSGGFRYSPERGRFRDYLGCTVRHAIQRFNERHARGAAWLSLDDELDGPAGASARSAGACRGAFPARSAEATSDPVWEREWMDHHFRMAMSALAETFDRQSIDVFNRIMAGAQTSAICEEFSLSAEAVRKIKQRVLARVKELVATQVAAEDEADE